jgi:hypothetical protein
VLLQDPVLKRVAVGDLDGVEELGPEADLLVRENDRLELTGDLVGGIVRGDVDEHRLLRPHAGLLGLLGVLLGDLLGLAGRDRLRGDLVQASPLDVEPGHTGAGPSASASLGGTHHRRDQNKGRR